MTKDHTFGGACETLEAIFSGETRSEILDRLSSARSLKDALLKLRSSIRAHTFKTNGGELHLGGVVRALDEKTQQDGFHVLIDWDGKANRWLDEMIPIDVLDYY